jgi:hypothetical protein
LTTGFGATAFGEGGFGFGAGAVERAGGGGGGSLAIARVVIGALSCLLTGAGLDEPRAIEITSKPARAAVTIVFVFGSHAERRHMR